MTESQRIHSRASLLRISNKLLARAESKHCAPGVGSDISVQLRILAEKVGYAFADIGAEAQRSADEERAYVTTMAAALQIRPIKIVITSCSKIWTDNTHWTLAALRRYGRDCTIGEVPHYVVQFTDRGARLIAPPPTMNESAAIESLRLAGNIQQRLDLGWRPLAISYTVGELFQDGRYDR